MPAHVARRPHATDARGVSCLSRPDVELGPWGDDDQLGTLNFITPEVRRAATALVSERRSVSCSNPLAVTPGPRNPNPAQHYMMIRDEACLDYIGVSYHGVVNTHIDALCHYFTGKDGQL